MARMKSQCGTFSSAFHHLSRGAIAGSAKELLSRLILPAAALLAFSGAAGAQQVNASIAGSVTDEARSVIPNASVVIESAPLAVHRTATTNAEGYFIVTNLPVGVYRVTVDAEGFGSYSQTNIKLDVGNTLSMTIVMGVKQIAQQV